MTARCRSITPPHAKGLLDQLETSFLDALRSGEGEAAPAALRRTQSLSRWWSEAAR